VAEKQINASILIIIVVVIAAAAASGGYYLGTRGGGGGWWNKEWAYRRQITVNNSGSLLENYQISMNIDYDGHMQSDFSDLRFVDGSTQLSYWIENYNPDKSADVWIKIPSIPANDTKTIWMYYGNPSANTEENAKETFIQYFDGNDYANWTVDAEHHVENSNGSLYIWSSPGDGQVCSRTFADLTYNTSVEFKVSGVNITTNQRNFFILGDNGLNNRLAQIDYPEQNTKIEYYDNFSGNIDDTTGHKFSLWDYMSSETYYRIRITVRLNEGKYGVSVWDWENGQLLGENANVSFPLGSPNSFDRIYTGDGTYGVLPTQTCNENLTWIFIRKYADPEPTVNIGSEESL
jgi:hypothetical protein